MHPGVLSLFLLNVICCSFVSCLYFHIGETEKKCFIEEIPDETMIIGEWRGKVQSNRLKLKSESDVSCFSFNLRCDFNLTVTGEFGRKKRRHHYETLQVSPRLCVFNSILV